MKKQHLFLTILMLTATPTTYAADWKASIDARADALSAQLKGSHSYHAYLALQYADKAVDEKSQHDLNAAEQFIRMAESEATKAKGK